MSILDRALRMGEAKKFKTYEQRVGRINGFEPELEHYTDAELKAWLKRVGKQDWRDAYVFLRDALDYTTKQQKKIKGTTVRHVAGPELLEGVRQYALKEFGPMVITVFSSCDA